METPALSLIVEASLLAAGRPLSARDLLELFGESERPTPEELDAAIESLAEGCRQRSLELVKVASGYRLQVRTEFSPWVSRLWEEKAPRYSRALMETLAVVAYRQPVTRGDIEDVRGVSVSSTIMRTLLDRKWIRVVGHRDVPGRPALYGTTREFLDYFGVQSLSDLPALDELRDLDEINVELDLGLTPPLQAAAATESDEGDAAPEGKEGGPATAAVRQLATVTPIRRPAPASEAAEASEAGDDGDPSDEAGETAAAEAPALAEQQAAAAESFADDEEDIDDVDDLDARDTGAIDEDDDEPSADDVEEVERADDADEGFYVDGAAADDDDDDDEDEDRDEDEVPRNP